MLHYWLMGLVLLNASFLVWNITSDNRPTLEHQPKPPPSPIATLELRNDVDIVPYRSSAAGTPSSCYSAGPYPSAAGAQAVAAKLQGFGLAVQLRKMQSFSTLRFLVYIPPLADFSQAKQMAQAIAKHDIADVAIITEGSYQNAISLGFFNNLTKAKRHAEYIRYLGFDAQVSEQQDTQEVFWIDYDEPFGSNAPVQAWSHTLAAATEIQRIPRACR
ncbi:MAG: SPOR domain-containing protein [Thiothrix sp.]